MKLFFSVFIYFSSLTYAFAQTSKYEQATFDYFFKFIYTSKAGVKWSFSGLVEPEANLLFPCFKDVTGNTEDYSTSLPLWNKLDSLTKVDRFSTAPINIASGRKQLYSKNRWVHRRNLMKIYRELVLENKHYVVISLVQIHELSTLYFFELDDNKNVVRWCLRSDIW